MRPQLASFMQVINGDAVPSEMSIYRSGLQVMCNLAAWFPRVDHGPSSEAVLTVRQGSGSLLVGLNDASEEVFAYHADHVRRFVHAIAIRHGYSSIRFDLEPQMKNDEFPWTLLHRRLEKLCEASGLLLLSKTPITGYI